MKLYPIWICGDIHGKWTEFVKILKSLPNDAILLQLGDTALGWGDGHCSLEYFEQLLSPILDKKNQQLLIIRGNHCNPNIWNLTPNSPRIKLIKDFTELQILGLNFYFIGGAISLDRVERTEGIDYWSNEVINFDNFIMPKNKVDVLITHSAPMFCYPVGFNDFCRYWFRLDRTLEAGITNERQKLSEIFDKIKPKLHYYGHFHNSKNEQIGECRHILLHELEVKQVNICR